MRKIIIIIFVVLIPAITLAYVSPGKPTGFVSDFANILNAQDKQAIESKLQSLRDFTGSEIEVATIPSLGNETIETFAVKLFEEWGIGKKGANNGLLILVAPNDREARIEVGYGLEGTITDLQAGRIGRDGMTPYFKTGNYASGIMEAVNAVSSLISNSADAQAYKDKYPNKKYGSSDSWFAVFFFVVIFLNFLARILGKTKSWWLGGVLGAIAGTIIGFITGFAPTGIIAVISLTIIGFVFDYFVSKHPPGSSGKGGGIWPIFFGGGGGGNGGFGGGFGGFGGGMSGGGGASVKW